MYCWIKLVSAVKRPQYLKKKAQVLTMALHLSATVSHHVQYQDSSAEAIKWNPAIILIPTCVFFSYCDASKCLQ